MVRVKEIGQLVQYLLVNHGVLNLITITCIKLAMVVSVCFPSTGDKETGGSLVLVGQEILSNQ